MSKNDAQIVISKKTLIIALIVLLLLIAGAVTLALGWNTWFGSGAPQGPVVTPTGELEIDENAGDWNGQTLPDKTDDAPAVGIKIPGYPSITLPKDQKTVLMYSSNSLRLTIFFTPTNKTNGQFGSRRRSSMLLIPIPVSSFASLMDSVILR